LSIWKFVIILKTLFSWKFQLEPERESSSEPTPHDEKQQTDLPPPLTTSNIKTPTAPASYEMNAVKKQESPHINATITSSKDTTIKSHVISNFTNNVTTANSSKEQCEWDHKVIFNHTLVGGINAGDFREHIQASTMDECMDQCCREQDCDLSFMIDKDCYTVKCLKEEFCGIRQAKETSFVPKIAFKRKLNDVESKFSNRYVYY